MTVKRLSPLHKDRRFPLSACILFGLGLGGFFDGIMLRPESLE